MQYIFFRHIQSYDGWDGRRKRRRIRGSCAEVLGWRHVIAMKPAFDRSAAGLMEILTETLEEFGISLDGLASDCFDGASVNFRWKNRIQAKLTSKCGRFMLYVHCINHRLHLGKQLELLISLLVTKHDAVLHFSICTTISN